MVISRLLSVVTVIIAISGTSCSEAGGPIQATVKHEPAEASGRSGGKRLPSELKLVVVQADDHLFVMIRNDGPGIAAISPIVSLYNPIRNISLKISSFPPGATTNLASRGFVMPESSMDAVVELPPKKMYGSTYSLRKLESDMRLPAGCYTFIAKYDGTLGAKNFEIEIAESEPARICLWDE